MKNFLIAILVLGSLSALAATKDYRASRVAVHGLGCGNGDQAHNCYFEIKVDGRIVCSSMFELASSAQDAYEDSFHIVEDAKAMPDIDDLVTVDSKECSVSNPKKTKTAAKSQTPSKTQIAILKKKNAALTAENKRLRNDLSECKLQ